jgi:hypothetical protein
MDLNRSAVFRASAALGTLLLMLNAATAAHAAPLLPAPSTLAECVADGALHDDVASCSLSSSNASASGSVVLWPFVSLTASSSTTPGGGSGAVVFATYSFEVVGGNPGDVVPIEIATNLSSSASSLDHAFGQAQLSVSTNFGRYSQVVCTNGSINPTCPTLQQAFSGIIAWSATSGEAGDTINLSVDAESGDSAFAEWANASADPFIFIDPNFINAANYSIIVSPGVGNGLPVTAVPEPATIALTGSGLIMLISRGRQRARHSRSPALR